MAISTHAPRGHPRDDTANARPAPSGGYRPPPRGSRRTRHGGQRPTTTGPQTRGPRRPTQAEARAGALAPAPLAKLHPTDGAYGTSSQPQGPTGTRGGQEKTHAASQATGPTRGPTRGSTAPHGAAPRPRGSTGPAGPQKATGDTGPQGPRGDRQHRPGKATAREKHAAAWLGSPARRRAPRPRTLAARPPTPQSPPRLAPEG